MVKNEVDQKKPKKTQSVILKPKKTQKNPIMIIKIIVIIKKIKIKIK
jgi:hypothetical protein